MRFKVSLIVVLFFPALIFYGCGKTQVSPDVINPVVLPENGENVIAAQNDFALKFFKELLEQDKTNSNKLVSPLSIYMDFSMAYNGAAGNTLDEMNSALQLGGISAQLLNEVNKALVTGLPKADSKVELDLANSIWYRNQGAQPLLSFIQTVSDNYMAQITGADFKSPQTVNDINSWVSKNTHGKISHIIDQIDPSDIMYLINAVYFKGQWKLKFDSRQTRSRVFSTPDAGNVQTPFMTQTAVFPYLENQSMQCIELPYGAGSFSMYVILPSANLTTGDLLSTFNSDILKSTLNPMDSTKVTLFMPRWEYKYDISDLRPELSALGMPVAFTGNADFTNMYPASAGAYISKALHKTFISVDEEGTKAAAVTSIGMGTTAVSPNPVMDINRPFLYLIVEKQTGSILFLGMVNNPAQ